MVACITCLFEISFNDYKSMDQKFEVDGKTMTFSYMFSLCTGLEFTEYDIELKPQHICSVCTKQVIDAYNFRQNCWKSYNALTNQIKDFKHDSPAVELSSRLSSGSASDDDDSYKDNVVFELHEEEDTRDFCDDFQIDQNYEDIKVKSPKIKNGSTTKVKKKKKQIFPKRMCPVCGKLISSSGKGLQFHMLTHTDAKPFKCELCEYKCAAKKFLKRHVNMVHNKTEPKWVCEYPNCGRTYHQKSALKAHQASHSDPTLECIQCQKKFHTSTVLKNHMKIHNLDTYVSCDFCDKKFARKCKMNEHRKTHTKEFVHYCEVCGKGFVHRHLWRTHMDKQHNITVT